MESPDFARLGPPALEHKDLLFLFEHFPTPGVSAEEAARRVIEQPNLFELLLESRYVFDAVLDKRAMWLDISPKLFFNVALRRALAGSRRNPAERRTIHYLVNLLALFVHTERLHRVQENEETRYEYLADLVQAAAEADTRRRFVVLSHIGNYALFLAGVCKPWIEHRLHFRKRPVTLDYYCAMGRSHYATAARHELADRYGLRPVFAQLSGRFDYYREGLERMAVQYLH
jgi:hypothetical protein